MGERDMLKIRRYVPWEVLFDDPQHTFLVWTGFRRIGREDQSFITELNDIRNATSAAAWEKFMLFWRHLAGTTQLLSLPSLESPRAGADSD